MGILDNITGTRANAGAQGQIRGVAGCERRIAELSGEKEKIYLKIGEKYAGMHMKDGAVGTAFENEVSELIRVDEEIDAVETRKLAFQGLRKCTACGENITLDSAFCNRCGAKLEPLSLPEPVESDVCPKCGSQLDSDSVFCMMCGYRLENQ